MVDALNKYGNFCVPLPREVKLQPHELGDWVHLKTWKSGSPQDQLNPIWVRPGLVLLITYSSLKLEGVTPQIHRIWVKKGPMPEHQERSMQTIDDIELSCEPLSDLSLLF